MAPEDGPPDGASPGNADGIGGRAGRLVDDWELTPGLCSAFGLGASGDSYDAPEGAARVQRKAVSMPFWASTGQVQARGDLHGEDTVAIAERGVASASSPLPHLDAIQRSFGSHDVSSVRAQIGGEAADASRAIGAEAYATGNRVAFSNTPDLHTAAHEAAHVVQQRAGVQLKGGVGEGGDQHERHADAVADLAVQERSAQGLLDFYLGGRSFNESAPTSSRGAIQKTGEGRNPDIPTIVGASLEEGLVSSFITGLLHAGGKGFDPAAMAKLNQDLKDPKSLLLMGANYGPGFLEGAYLSVASNLEVIWEIFKFTHHTLPGSALQELKEFLKDPAERLAREQKESEERRALLDGMMMLVPQLVANKQVFMSVSESLGEVAGDYMLTVGNGFANAQPAQKGRLIGKVVGYISVEIALLIVSPEEIAAKFPAVMARVARTGKLGAVVAGLMEKIPALSKLLEAIAKVGKVAEAATVEAKLLAHLEPAIAKKVLQEGLGIEQIKKLAVLEKPAAEKLLGELTAKEVLELEAKFGKAELEKLARDKTGKEIQSIAHSNAPSPETSGAAPESREGLVDVLSQRQQQILVARGDLNKFRANFRLLTSDGGTPRTIGDIAPQLEQLLTRHRRTYVVTGGGRYGSGVSTHIESLDGKFSIRITHSQVGSNPVGNPPMPRIHVYDRAPPAGHGDHLVLARGTTLDHILQALGGAP